jgi:hypothetical protein
MERGKSGGELECWGDGVQEYWSVERLGKRDRLQYPSAMFRWTESTEGIC